MPLRALVASSVEVPAAVGPPAVPLPPTVPPSAAYVTWTPADGPELILSKTADRGIHLGGVGSGRSIIGLDMPPEEQFDTDLATGDGQLMNSRRFGPRPFSLPVVIHADGVDELKGYRETLITSFNPVRGEGVFMIAYPDGTRRHLGARYFAGLDVAEQGRMGGGLDYDSYTIVLKARDPFPYGDLRMETFSAPVAGSFYPIPFTISASSTTGDSEVTIDGQVEVWPGWRLVGPMTTVTLRNRDTGKTLSLTPGLTAGQTLTVRTDPRTVPLQRFTRETGSSVWATVAGQFPVMWSLQPGRNRITVTAAGTTSASSIRLSYRPRYLSA